jgi:hypothetical protein
MRAALALVLLVAAGLGLATESGGPELRAVKTPAAGIEAPSGALLAATEFDGPARLQWVRPGTLRPVSRPLRLEAEFVADFALSPDGGRMAIGSEMHSRIQLVDLRRWRSLGVVDLPLPAGPGSGGVSGLVWASKRRLLALSGMAYGAPARPVVVDPVRRRVVHAPRWRGRPLQSRAAGRRVLFLAAPQGGSKPGRARLVSFDAAGRLRELRLGRIEAGGWERSRVWHLLEPALAVTRRGDRAYVVSTDDRLVAEIDLRRWGAAYHELSEPMSAWRRLLEAVDPPARAKGPVDSQVRHAEVLANGAIAVTGEDTRPTDRPHGAAPTPIGVRLIDPGTWSVRTVDHDAQYFTVAGGRLLARRWALPDGQGPIGLRAYDTAGTRRWTRFEGAGGTIVRGAAGRLAYVEARQAGRRRIHVLELDSGRTVRTLPWREVRVLER